MHSRPGPSGYEALNVLAPGHLIPVVIDGAEVCRIPVDDVLLRARPTGLLKDNARARAALDPSQAAIECRQCR